MVKFVEEQIVIGFGGLVVFYVFVGVVIGFLVVVVICEKVSREVVVGIIIVVGGDIIILVCFMVFEDIVVIFKGCYWVFVIKLCLCSVGCVGMIIFYFIGNFFIGQGVELDFFVNVWLQGIDVYFVG